MKKLINWFKRFFKRNSPSKKFNEECVPIVAHYGLRCTEIVLDKFIKECDDTSQQKNHSKTKLKSS